MEGEIPELEISRACSTCGLPDPKFKCSRCKNVYYCSRDCQSHHWKMHRHFCVYDETPQESSAAILFDCENSPFPAGMLLDILGYLDGAGLAQVALLCRGLRAVSGNDSLWQRLCGIEADINWLPQPKPKRRTWRKYYIDLRLAVMQKKPAKLYVVGGTRHRVQPIRHAEVFEDAGPGATRSSWRRLRSMGACRAACGVAVDAQERLVAIGGWDGARAMTAVERYSPALDLWEYAPPLSLPNCFLGAIGDREGRVHIAGGGNSMYVGADVYRTCAFLDPNVAKWKTSYKLNQRRCGLGLSLSPQNHLFAAGGYGGEVLYHNSVEYLDLTAGTDNRGWVSIEAKMYCSRTGLGVTWGPDNCLYCIGGSSDGVSGQRTAEKYDPRIGAWELLAPMRDCRGYCAAAFGMSGYLYAVGGTHLDTVSKVIEVYDVRMNKWSIICDSESIGRPITDLSMLAMC